jgi:CHAT domain-containing protein
MGKFYTNLSQDTQITKARALRKAQLELLMESDSQYRHPFYWAPFVLVGNWL